MERHAQAPAPQGTRDSVAAGADVAPSPAWQEWRTHWRVGVVACIGSGLSYAVWIYISSLFVQPLQDAFGWTRGQIALGQNAALASALAAPFVGRLIDRLGPRRVLLAGLPLTAVTFALMAVMGDSLLLFYGLLVMAAVVGISTTGLSYSRVVCAAFVHSRGVALAATRGGMAITGALLPMAVQATLAMAGWRAGLALYAGLMLVGAWPLLWWWLPRDRPAPAAAAAAGRQWGLLREPAVLLLCATVCLAFTPLIASFSQMHPLLVGKGIDAALAGRILGLLGLAGLAGAVVTGLLLDRFPASWVGALFAALPCVGFVLLLDGSLTPLTAALAVALVGFGYGAETDLMAYMIARYFGLQRMGVLYGLTVLSISVGVAAASTAMGLVHDRLHTYDPALWVFAGLCLAAAAGYLGLGRMPTAGAPGGGH